VADELQKAPDVIPPTTRRAIAPTFEQLEVDAVGDTVTLRHTSDEGVLPMILLGVTTAAFVLFVVVVLPLLRVTGPAALLWLVIGFAVLGAVGIAMQIRTRTTQVRLDEAGITIDQGTPIDREHAAIVWGEITSVELEPVDPKDGKKGMQLRIVPRSGEPIDTLLDVAIGDLSETRRIIIDRWNARRAKVKRRRE
jgi:hypothetical protein